MTAPLASPASPEPLRLFISYSRKDSRFARKLARALEALGADVWIDTQDIEAGAAWTDEVQRGLDRSQVMLLVLSPDAMESKYVTAEWLYFVEQNKPLIPVLHRPTVLNFQLRPLQYVDFVTQDYDDAFAQLQARLFGRPAAEEPPRKRPPGRITPALVSKLRSNKPLEAHTDSVRDIAFSPDSALFVTGSEDRTVRLWHTSGRKSSRIKGIGHEKAVHVVAFSPAGTYFASGSEDRTVRLWHAEKNICLTALGHGGPVTGLAYSPAAPLLVSCGSDGTLRLWDLQTPGPAGTIPAHDGVANDVAFSPDGALLASGGEDRLVKLWAMGDADSHPEIAAIPVPDSVYHLAFSPDGAVIAAGLVSEGLAVLDVAAGRVLERVRYADFNANCVRGVAFSPDGALLAVGSLDGKIRLWNAARLRDGRPGKALRALTGHESGVTGVAFSPDGTVLASIAHDKTIRLWTVHKSA